MNKTAAQQIVNAANYSPVEVAKIAGRLKACAEADMTWKEASQFLDVPVQALEAVSTLAFGS
jgi:hypothetical protein